jgi:hypothetical protein
MTALDLPSEEPIVIVVDPADPSASLEKVRRELQQPVDPPLVLDLAKVTYAGPRLLEMFDTMLQLAGDHSREIWLEHTAPSVYKALQIAKLDGFRRRARGPGR